jgi:hypothetical protein
MPRLCRFKELPSNTDIYVNPTLVEYVKPATGSPGAFIYFAKEHLIWVDLSAEKTTQALENALKVSS